MLIGGKQRGLVTRDPSRPERRFLRRRGLETDSKPKQAFVDTNHRPLRHYWSTTVLHCTALLRLHTRTYD